ncbi:unnamed protein product [Sphenostylis stenocarpa]|uniref:Phytosulfokine n=1 Tax=Sphenostylis stenocarpa TaxID=92480 RepID=A0AA86VM69_9FABA|nr:unnamed protein product [Sphenostylis stenocarpa]
MGATTYMTKVGALVGFELKTKMVNGFMQSSIGCSIYLFLLLPSLVHALISFSCFYPSLLVSHSLNIEPMKPQIGWLFFVLLLSSFLASARLLKPPKGPGQGEKEMEVNDNAIPRSSLELKDDMEELMGSKGCYTKDEAGSIRRMMVEAHLDYIYTQHHKP